MSFEIPGTETIKGPEVVVGIDIGKEGALVALDAERRVRCALRTKEAFTSPTGKGSKRDYVEMLMVRQLLVLREAFTVRAVLVEKASVRPGEGISGGLTVGQGEGLWRGMVAALGLPLVRVAPQTWMAKMCRDVPGEGKDRAIFAAAQRLPGLELVPKGCRKPHSGIADAALLAVYGWEYAKEP